MISLAELEYLNSCFNSDVVKDEPINKENTFEEMVDIISQVLGKSFGGFVLTVIDDKGDQQQITTTNLESLEAVKAVNGMLDALEMEIDKGF